MWPMHCSKSTGVILLIVGIVLPRLAFFLSNDFIPDLDEAALGIQIQKWIDGIAVHAFFPGQTHNWVGLEIVLAVPGLALFPPSLYALKLPVLLIFISAMVLFYCVGLRSMRPLPLALLLIFVSTLPPLLVWSMKFRGGYVPAFFFMSVVAYVISMKRVWPIHMLIVGAALMLMFQSHILCALAALLPLSVRFKEEFISVWYLSFTLLGALLGWLITQIGVSPNLLFPPDNQRFAEGFAVFSAPIFKDVWQFLSGQFLFWQTPEPSFWFVGVPLLFFLLVFISATKRRVRAQHFVLFVGILMFYWLFQPFPLRYGIPFLFAFVGLIAMEPPQIRGQWLVLPVIYLMVLPYVVPFTHTHIAGDDNERLESRLRIWATDHEQYDVVFCEDETIAYLMNFYGSIHYRAKPAYSRFQRDWYDAELALRNGGTIGLMSASPIIEGRKGRPIGRSFYLHDGVDQQVLNNLGFSLKE